MKTKLPTRVTATLGAVAIAVAMAGCGTTDQPSDKPPVTEITFWSWLKGSEDVAAAFNAAHDDVEVKFEKVTGGNDYYSKLANAVKAGNAPDVATVEYAKLPEVVSQGELQPLPKSAQPALAKFPGSVLQQVTFGGKSWALPLDVGSVVLYYRKDLFDKHGIAVPKTWADFKAAAEKVKAADPKARIVDLPSGFSITAALCWQAGAKWFGVEGQSWKVNIDSPQTRKVAQYWQGMADSDLVWEYLTGKEMGQKRAESAAWTQISGAWQAGYLKTALPGQSGKWASAPLPSWDGKATSAVIGGSSFGVPKGSTKADAAAKFIAWMTTTPEGFKARLKAGTSSALPAAPDLVAAAKETFPGASYFANDIYAVAAEAVETIPTGWVWGPAMATASTAFGDQIKQVKAGTIKLTDVYGPVQKTVVGDIKDRGLSVVS